MRRGHLGETPRWRSLGTQLCLPLASGRCPSHAREPRRLRPQTGSWSGTWSECSICPLRDRMSLASTCGRRTLTEQKSRQPTRAIVLPNTLSEARSDLSAMAPDMLRPAPTPSPTFSVTHPPMKLPPATTAPAPATQAPAGPPTAMTPTPASPTPTAVPPALTPHPIADPARLAIAEAAAAEGAAFGASHVVQPRAASSRRAHRSLRDSSSTLCAVAPASASPGSKAVSEGAAASPGGSCPVASPSSCAMVCALCVYIQGGSP